MSPSMAKLRIDTYGKKYGKMSIKKLRTRVLELENIQKTISCYSKRYRILAQEVFELNSYANSLEEVQKIEKAPVKRPNGRPRTRTDGLLHTRNHQVAAPGAS